MWVNEKQSEIYTLLEYYTKSKLSGVYKNLNFTKEEESSLPTNEFPNVLIKFLNGKEKAQTIKGTTINAILCTIQIDVTSNKTQGLYVAEDVIWNVVESAKRLGFELFYSPEPMPTGNDTKRIVARMRRTIGSNDKF